MMTMFTVYLMMVPVMVVVYAVIDFKHRYWSHGEVVVLAFLWPASSIWISLYNLSRAVDNALRHHMDKSR